MKAVGDHHHGLHSPSPGWRIRGCGGVSGTPAGLGLRLTQDFFASAALAVTADTNDFPSVFAFSFDRSSSMVSFSIMAKPMSSSNTLVVTPY